MAITVNTPRDFTVDLTIEHFPVAASTHIYEGQMLGDNGSGYARPLVAGDKFLGFALEEVDNSTGSAGDKLVRTKKEGAVAMPVASLAITDLGKSVYAADDSALYLVASSYSYVGLVAQFDSSGNGLVEFGPGRVGRTPSFTDNTGGTASTTLATMNSATFSYATFTEVATELGKTRNALASIASFINTLAKTTK